MSEGRWVIPKTWSWTTVDDIADVVSGGTPDANDPDNFSEVGIPWITPADLSGFNSATIARGRRDLSPRGLQTSSAVLLPPGSVLFSSRAPIGYCVLAANPIATNQGFKSLLLRGELNAQLIRFYLLSAISYAESLASGTTFKELSGARMKELLVPIPPLPEQKRIVKRIEELQSRSKRAREALETVPALIEKFRQSVLAAAFRGDLTKEWREKNKDKIEPASELLKRIRAQRRKKWEEEQMKTFQASGKTPKDDSWKKKYKEPEAVDKKGLPELPEGWCWVDLESLIHSLGQGWSPKCENRPSESLAEWGIIKTSAIQAMHFHPEENKALPEQLEADTELEICDGDLIITRAGPRSRAGVCCLVHSVRPRLMICDKVYRFRADISVVLPDILEMYLNEPHTIELIDRMKTGISDSGVNLTQDKFLGILVALPPLCEQRLVVQQVSAAFSRIDHAEHFCSAVVGDWAALDQSILARAFRGELVPQDPSDEPASVLLDRIKREKGQSASATTVPKSRLRKKKGVEA